MNDFVGLGDDLNGPESPQDPTVIGGDSKYEMGRSFVEIYCGVSFAVHFATFHKEKQILIQQLL